MSPPLRVATVVVTWNGRDRLGSCVRSLVDQKVPDGWEHQVVVVDNGSVDGSADWVRTAFPTVTVLRREHNGGYGAGANTGVRGVDADVVAVVNDDARYEPTFTAALVAPLLADASVGATTATVVLEGAFVRAPDGDFVGHDGTRWRRDASGRDDAVPLLNSTGNLVSVSGNGRDRGWLAPLGTDYDADVFGFHGGACALRRAALDDVGLFDETLFMYYEDTDLSWRLRRHGWSVRWARDAVSHHAHAASSGTGSRRFVRWNTRNRVVVALRNAPASTLPGTLSRALGSVASTAVRAARTPGDAAAREELLGRLGGVADVVVRFPSALRARRSLDRRARVPSSRLRGHLVPDS
ncbi:glycosyltransferase family 2 protein [uncultured Frigoribacterium sp.]|uniref:glycosyltransferase family 2 protein n=1 Tax=uncultured Frigoribacterium sp. TaxID=335377 RepID=UPI0028D84148|nr:glycosyltransferase family 2 protein [uncultured Frigoribacterium sp.]